MMLCIQEHEKKVTGCLCRQSSAHERNSMKGSINHSGTWRTNRKLTQNTLKRTKKGGAGDCSLRSKFVNGDDVDGGGGGGDNSIRFFIFNVLTQHLQQPMMMMMMMMIIIINNFFILTCWLNSYRSQLQSQHNNKSTKICHVSYKYFCNTTTTTTTTNSNNT
jgi:hypothetical protein